MKNRDYEARIKFMQEFEKWRKDNAISYRQIIRDLDLHSTATYNAWVDPIVSDKPMVKLKNIVKMSKMSGIKFVSKYSDEQTNYEDILNELSAISDYDCRSCHERCCDICQEGGEDEL